MKNKKKFMMSLAISFAVMLSAFIGATTSFASEGLDLGVNIGNMKLPERSLRLNQSQTSKEAVINEIKKIRSRAWDENIYYCYEDNNSRGYRIRDIAKMHKSTSKEDYVEDIHWSTELERIAIQRAIEQIITGLSHTRADGSNWHEASYKGITAGAEVLAMNSASMGVSLAFDQWSFRRSNGNKSEYDYLIASKGVMTADNGHLHAILDPGYFFVGYADVNNTGSKWNYAVGEFSNDGTVSETSTGLVGDYVFSRSNSSTTVLERAGQSKPENPTTEQPSSNKLSKETRQNLEKAIKDSKKQIDAANYLMENFPKTIEKVYDKLVNLIKIANDTISQAENLLNNN